MVAPHLLLGVIFFILSYVILRSPTFSNNKLKEDRQDASSQTVDIVSSVWCVGANRSDRFCSFKDVCYSPIHKEFIFYHGHNSVIFGVPTNRFESTLAELSSVENHNVHYFNYIDLPSKKHASSDINYIETPTQLFNRFYPDNLMHVFHDDLLPLYSTLGMLCKDKFDKTKCTISVLLFDNNNWGPFEDLYKGLFERISLVQTLPADKLHCFKQLYIGVNKQTVWYQYGFHVPQGPLNINTPSRVSSLIQHFRKYFSDTLLSRTTSDNNSEVVILTRKTNRQILNTNAIVNMISEMTKKEVKVLNLEEYKISEIVTYIQQARLLVAMHGSLLILSMFLKPNSVVIELFPYAVNPSQYTPYKTLATFTDVIYEAWQNKFQENTFSYPNNPPSIGGIAHLRLDKQKDILESTEVPLHLCCDNPEWLFRIYQDTVVDLASFQRILETALQKQNSASVSHLDEKCELYPSKVLGAVCQVDVSAKTLTVEWKVPWNLQFFYVDVVEYELWVQKLYAESNDDDTKAYLLTRTRHVFENVDVSLDYLMWVRCIADLRHGPFINAVKCSKT